MKDEVYLTGPSKKYAIDWDKVESVDDIKRILKAFNFVITPGSEQTFDTIKDLLMER